MESTTPNPAAGILGAIGTYGATKGADYILEQVTDKLTVKRIVRKDKKYIRQLFTGSKKGKCPTEEAFLLGRIFQNDKFLFPGDKLPKKKQGELRQEFISFLADCNEIKPRENTDIDKAVEKLTLCVDYHNHLIHQYFFSRSDKLMLTAFSNKLDITGYSGGTLNSDNEFLTDNGELEYTHLQLDSIIHAFRMDLRFYRFVLLIELIAIFVLVPVTVFLFSKFKQGSSGEYTGTLLALSIVLIILFVAAVFNFLRISVCERKVQRCSEQLWALNFQIYKADLINGRHFVEDARAQSRSLND